MKRRPLRILLLCLVFADLAIFGIIRIQQAIQNWDLAVTLIGLYFPIYGLVSGIAWTLAGLIGAISLWTRRTWARPAAWGFAIFFPFSYWLEELVVLKSPTRLTNWEFAAVVSIIWLLLVALALQSRGTTEYFTAGRDTATRQKE